MLREKTFSFKNFSIIKLWYYNTIANIKYNSMNIVCCCSRIILSTDIDTFNRAFIYTCIKHVKMET